MPAASAADSSRKLTPRKGWVGARPAIEVVGEALDEQAWIAKPMLVPLRSAAVVDPHHVPVGVGEWPAAVSGVDRGVGLEDVGKGFARPGDGAAGRDAAVKRRDDALCHRAGGAERASDRNHLLAEPDLARVGEGRQGQRSVPDGQNGDVADRVGAFERGGEVAAVEEEDLDRATGGDDVVVGDHEGRAALVGDREGGALVGRPPAADDDLGHGWAQHVGHVLRVDEPLLTGGAAGVTAASGPVGVFAGVSPVGAEQAASRSGPSAARRKRRVGRPDSSLLIKARASSPVSGRPAPPRRSPALYPGLLHRAA